MPQMRFKRTVCTIATDDKLKFDVLETIRLKAKDPQLRSDKKLLFEIWSGCDFCYKMQKYVIKWALIDKEYDLSAKIIRDMETGAVIYSDSEPLKKHTGHGSVKKRTPENSTAN
jgi:hypothetical protein